MEASLTFYHRTRLCSDGVTSFLSLMEAACTANPARLACKIHSCDWWRS